MDTTLEEYIASNAELQETVNFVKAQMKQSKMDRDLLNNNVANIADKSSSTSDEDDDGDDDDVMEIDITDEEQGIWKGPSSKRNYLSFNSKEDADESDDSKDEFTKMYARLNGNLKKIGINEKGKQANDDLNHSKDEFKETNNNFDLRQIINKKRLEANNTPSITSQQWRLREPNVGEHRPAGMPPLVPIALLDKFPDTNEQMRNKNIKNKNKKRWHNKKKSFTQKRNQKNVRKPIKKDLPQVWDVPIGNANVTSAGTSFNSDGNVMQRSQPNKYAKIQNVGLFLDGNGGVQCLPVGKILNTADNTYLNENVAVNTLMGSTPNQGYIILNDPAYNESLQFTQTNVPVGRSVLNSIRGGGRFERLQNDSSHNNRILHQALNHFLNSANVDGSNGSTLHGEAIFAQSTNQSTTLVSAVQNMLEQGIIIKLAKPDN